eukprot:268048-Lingulodinium_polyedra.AAC.1
MAQGSDAVEQSLRDFVRPGFSADKAGERFMSRLLESGKELLRRKAQQLITHCSQRPLLLSYSADATPIISSNIMMHEEGGGAKRKKGAKKSEELLVQQAYLRFFDGSGQARTAAIFCEPIPLSFGKSGEAVFGCGREFLPLVRDSGHWGISIYHFSFDGGLYKKQTRLFTQHLLLKAKERQVQVQQAGRSPRRLYLTEWVVSSLCAAHQVHNSLKWGITEVYPNGELLKDVWLAVSSLKHNSHTIQQQAKDWIGEVVKFVDTQPAEWMQVRRHAWTMLGFPTHLMEVLVAELQLDWDGTNLRVNRECRKDHSVYDKVMDCVFAGLVFRDFTESRWSSIGKTSRLLCISFMLGLESLMEKVKRSPGSAPFYFSSWDRIHHEDVMPFLATTAFASPVPDAVLLLVMEDNRGGLQWPLWLEAATEEMVALGQVPLAVWEVFAQSLCKGTVHGMVLYDKAMQAASIAFAFMQEQLFQHVQKMPWALGKGDIAANLQTLAEAPEPVERTTSKIWHLLKMGFNREQLVQGVRLMMESAWATTSAEQQHGSVSVIRKFHPEYTEERLR